MTAIGMETFLSRPPNRSPSDAERAMTANTVGADLMISLRCATQASPSANGVASFHFGNSHGSVSTIGRNLADFIQREVVARTGLRDCRTHGRTWDLLRLTRMPTVQVDVGYITNPRDRDMLVSSQTRDSIAEGILAAVKRLYLLGKNDRPTGTFTFAELLAHELSVEQAGRVLVGQQIAGARADGLLAASPTPAAAPAPPPHRPSSPGRSPARGAAAGSSGAAPPRRIRPVLQKVDVEDALVDRAVTEHLHHRRQFRRNEPGVDEFRGLPRCGRRLPVPAHRGEPGPPRRRRSGSAADRARHPARLPAT